MKVEVACGPDVVVAVEVEGPEGVVVVVVM